MAYYYKSESKRAASSSKYTSPQLPPQSSISISCIPLPKGYSVRFSQYSAPSSYNGHLVIDSARRSIFRSNIGKTLENSLLTYSQISDTSSTLWIYSIESPSEISRGSSDLLLDDSHELDLSNLTNIGNGRFSYKDIYPCSCNLLGHPLPCSICNSNPKLTTESSLLSKNSQISLYSSVHGNGEGSRGHLTPLEFHTLQPTKKTSYLFFLDALRERVINDICEHSQSLGTVARRLDNGIIWGLPGSCKDWGTGWEHHAHYRYLTFSHIRITLSSSGIMIQPHIQSTRFLPLYISLPPFPGTPINLLPFSTPAFYLNTYTGPTSGLVKQFELNLVGLGVGNCFSSPDSTDAYAQFVIAWIDIQNEQGVEKGLVIIWPASLCLTLPACTRRAPLTYLPELPITLQASPIPAPATVPISNNGDSPRNSFASPLAATSFSHISDTHGVFSASPFDGHITSTSLPCIATNDGLYVQYMDLSLRSNASSLLVPCNTRGLSLEIGKYVDSVARERERERERIKKEKDSGAAQEANKVLGFSDISSRQQVKLEEIFVGDDPTQQYATQTLDNVASLLQNSPVFTMGTQPSQILVQSDLNHTAPLPYPSPPEEIPNIDQFGRNEKQILEVIKDEGLLEGTQGSDSPSEQVTRSQIAFELPAEADKVIIPNSASTGFPPSNVNYDLESLRTFTEDDFDFFDSPIDAIDQLSLQQASNFGSESLTISASFPEIFSENIDTHNTLPSSEPIDHPVLYEHSVVSLLDPCPTSDMAKQELESGLSEASISSVSSPLLPISPKSYTSYKFLQNFQAIPLPTHEVSIDTKYAIGKFSSQIFTREGVRGEPHTSEAWAAEYAYATDPRFAIRQKLIKVKDGIQHIDVAPTTPYFETQWDVCMDDETAVAEVDSQYISDNDDDSECTEYEAISRTETPLPTHLPLGPTLIATKFSHSLLFPISNDLRLSGISSVGMGSLSPIPNPVPTPISPAAVSTSETERHIFQENIFLFIGNELSKNTVWAYFWRAISKGQTRNWCDYNRTGPEDEFFDKNYLFSSGWKWDRIAIDSYTSIESRDKKTNGRNFVLFDEPRFVVGKSDVLLHVSPATIRFGDKLGLTPRSGPKDVCTFLFYEDTKSRTSAERWMDRVAALYSSKGYGEHEIGCSETGPQGALLPIQFSDFQRPLENTMRSIVGNSEVFLIYVAIPASVILSKSQIFHRVILSIVDVKSIYGNQICFHLVPDFLISSDDDEDASSSHLLNALVDEVYDRIPRFVDEAIVDTFPKPIRQIFQAPSFCLAEELRKVQFSYVPMGRGINPFGRHSLLQVGYRLSECRKWLIAACTDQRGEADNLHIWHVSETNDYKQIVSRIWEFVVKFLSMADVEWRVSIMKLGEMDEFELQSWNIVFNSLSVSNSYHIPLHVSLLSIDESGWLTLTRDLAMSCDVLGKGRTISSSYSSYMLPLYCLPPSPIGSDGLGTQQSIRATDNTPRNSTLHLRPLRSAILVNAPQSQHQFSLPTLYIHLFQVASSPNSTLSSTHAQNLEDICRNYHDLAVLNETRQKYSLTKHRYPYQIAALYILEDVLELCESLERS